jgi:RNA polymerase sigma-70 factor (ECF subfamily)
MIKPRFDLSTISEASDESLMKAITHRRSSALNELYSRYGGRLKSMIGTVVHEEGEADDVLQDIMIQIWRDARKYSPKAGRPLGWIVTMTRRRAIDRVRRRQAYARAKERYSDTLDGRFPIKSLKPSSEEVAHNDMRTFLNQHLQRLPPLQREAVTMSFFKGMSHREIAQATNTPLGTVKTRLELGLQKLTQAVGPLRNKI